MKSKHLLCLVLVLGGGFAIRKSDAAILYPKAPDGGRAVVLKYLDPTLIKFLKISNVEDLTICTPFPVYAGGDLLKGQMLSGARLIGWDYPLMQGTNYMGGVNLRADAAGEKPLKFSSLGQFPLEGRALEALRMAEKWPRVQGQDYEFRYLNMAPEEFFAVWLHGKSDDIIIPLPPTWGLCNAYQPYSEREITKMRAPEVARSRELWRKLNEERHGNEDAYKNAMTAWEKAHGGNCGAISYYGASSPIEKVGTNTEIFTLIGMSEKCGELRYKARVTYGSNGTVVKKVGILEKIVAPALKFVSVDSEEANGENGSGRNAVDGDPNTIWHTQWRDRSPGLPHEIVIELVPPAIINGFSYLPRQDTSDHGTIKDYEFYVSNDGRHFGQPVNKGTFGRDKLEKIETFKPIKCRFVKLKAVSEINGLPFTSAAEIRVIQPDGDDSPKDYWRGDVGPAPSPQDSNKPDAVDSFVAAFLANDGLLLNGVDTPFNESDAATPEDVVSEAFRTFHFQSGMMTRYRIVDLRTVPLGGDLGTYTVALADTNLGEMIVLMQKRQGYWWRRIYSASAPYNRLD